ncbi:MAG TPA: glycosyltransferase [Kiritimatiellia bacterium]|nr:glycosyltransferase [Kiritimatiellia bacterium]
MRGRVDQVLAGFADGDAISHEALVLQGIFRKRGWVSRIFVDGRHCSPSMRDQCEGLEAYDGGEGDVLIHHYSIQSPALDRFVGAAARKVLIYHNITPAEFFRGFDDGLAEALAGARRRLPEIGKACDAVIAVSEFNASELRGLGLEKVSVLPLFFSPQALDAPSDPEVAKRLGGGLTTLLYVGRLAPNKKVEDLIEGYGYYSRLNPYSRLVIVGSERSCPRYFSMLKMLTGDLDLPNVCFEGFASPGGLPTYYSRADVFLTTSEHEGYCLPLLEAMYKKVPVIARKVGGIPEALDGAGVMYEGLDAPELGGLIDLVVSDKTIRGRVLESQDRRMRAVLNRDLEGEVMTILGGLAPSC